MTYKIVLVDTATVVVTLPANPSVGETYYIKNANTGGNITIARNGNNIDGAATDITAADNTAYMVTSDGTDWWVMAHYA